MKLSLIIAVLESYDVVRRQLLWYGRFLPNYPDVEFILVDDGSRPEIVVPAQSFNFKILRTHDYRPWTQPCARNFGAKHSAGEYLLFTDIDHFFTEECIREARGFGGDKLQFYRDHGVLDADGGLDVSEAGLRAYAPDLNPGLVGVHYNTFAMRRTLFKLLGGYDPKFCGKYGGDDTDLSQRYGELHRKGVCARHEMANAVMYVYPDPKWDRLKVFHHLRWQ